MKQKNALSFTCEIIAANVLLIPFWHPSVFARTEKSVNVLEKP